MRGFTIMELIIVISIFVIITSILLADYPGFSQRVALERTAQEVALSFREAETLALAVRESTPGSGDFPGFGVHFDEATPREYILFADLNNNNVFGGSVEELDRFFIEKSPEITDMCVRAKSSPPGNCGVASVDIIYLRPDPIITITNDGDEFSSSADFTITIMTPDGARKDITAWFTGQIEIE